MSENKTGEYSGKPYMIAAVAGIALETVYFLIRMMEYIGEWDYLTGSQGWLVLLESVLKNMMSSAMLIAVCACILAFLHRYFRGQKCLGLFNGCLGLLIGQYVLMFLFRVMNLLVIEIQFSQSYTGFSAISFLMLLMNMSTGFDTIGIIGLSGSVMGIISFALLIYALFEENTEKKGSITKTAMIAMLTGNALSLALNIYSYILIYSRLPEVFSSPRELLSLILNFGNLLIPFICPVIILVFLSKNELIANEREETE